MEIFQAFGLRANPFSTTPDPQFAYETKEHQLAIVKTLYSIQERMGLFLLRGEIGSGKTTIAKFLLQALSADENYHLAYLDSMNQRTEAGFLRAINAGFGLPTPFKTEDIKRELHGFLNDAYAANKIPVLLIDEAQKILSTNLHTIHGLSNLETTKHKLLQIALFAQPNFTNKIEQMPQLRSRITGSAYLNALSFDDALSMLRFRVEQVADADDVFDRIFPGDRLRHDIYKAAGGVPRDLCVLCNAALVNAFGRGQRCVNGEALSAAIDDFRSIKFQEGRQDA